MKNLFNSVYKDKTVLVTGHTGFKGSWLSEWLLLLGAKVIGVSLLPESKPSLFYQLRLDERVEKSIIGNIQDFNLLYEVFQDNLPDLVFHLAAQPLVIESYRTPVNTYSTNVMGTISVLEALRGLKKKCSAVFVTSDKCYYNREWIYGYREFEALGGHDPYSASKAAAELVIDSYRKSYFQKCGVAISSVRAGNVIGGGDWAENRIVPDCIRSLLKGEEILVRNPTSTRPWQHVLDPLSGYLTLGQRIFESLEEEDYKSLKIYSSAYNFGPSIGSNRKVESLVVEILKHWEGQWKNVAIPGEAHEANHLNLSIEKAYHRLGWMPVWEFKEAISKTVEWYKEIHGTGKSVDVNRITREQIYSYSGDLKNNQKNK